MSAYRCKFLFRCPVPDHEQFKLAAVARLLSLNAWILEACREKIQRDAAVEDLRRPVAHGEIRR